MKRSLPNVPEALLAVIFGLALLGQFERLQTPFGLVNWHEAAIGLFIVAAGPHFWRQRPRVLRLIRKQRLLLGLLFAFGAWTLTSTMLNAIWLSLPLLLKTGTAYLIRLYLYVAFGLSVWLAVDLKLVHRTLLDWLLRWWLLAMAALGIGQYLFFPDTRGLLFLGWDEHLNRAFGTLLDPGFFGLLMAIGTIRSLKVWLQRASGPNWRPVIEFAIFLLGLALSFSRASYLAYIIGVSMLAWAVKSKRLLLFIPLLIMALVLVPKDGGGEGQKLARTNSLAARVEVAQLHTTGLTAREVLLGRGWYYEAARQLHRAGIERETGVASQAINLRQNAQAVDNAYLHVWLSTGVVGFGIFIFAGIVAARNLGRSPQLAVWAAVLAHSFFSTGIFYPWILLVLGAGLRPGVASRLEGRTLSGGSGRT